MKPIIGIVGRPNFPQQASSQISCQENYRQAIIKNGGIPILIMPPKLINYNDSKPSEIEELTKKDKAILNEQLKLCNGILMPGGYKTFNHDFYILEYAIKEKIPVLGICLGMQIMSNYKQEFYNEKNTEKQQKHFNMDKKYAHDVLIDKNSKLYKILKKERIRVNSMHNFHAAKKGIYNIAATSNDGIIEALELPDQEFNFGVQWHPEKLDDENSINLIKTFVEYSKKSKK